MGSSTIGGTTQPIYWNGSAFVNTSYTLGKSVPSNAKFTDTIYTLPLADVLAKGGFRAGYSNNYRADHVKYGVSVVSESNLSNYECAYVGIDTVSHNYAGLMSTADKVKLDGIATFTAVTGKPTANQTPLFGGTFTISQVTQNANGQITVTDRTVKIPNSTAAQSNSGLMSASDKTKLDNLTTKVLSLESQISTLNNRINEILSGGYY